ncbi:sigma-70 family RNA polymerase sigma factor [Patescibacteria group bacterium]|nr:MAG: sigma-70 family RNA polymerase sigma factor [Patescibacteria group bacterium]
MAMAVREARIEARVKNNVLYQAIYGLGISAADFCHQTGFPLNKLYAFICLRCSPYSKRGGFTPQAEQLANLIGIPPEELFPCWLYQLEKTRASMEISLNELPPGFRPLLIEEATSPEQEVITRELVSKLPDLLGKLEARQQTIIRLRFGLGGEEPKTLEETGKIVNLSRERIRDIEKKALRKLERVLRRR